jgi:hypothetical protein
MLHAARTGEKAGLNVRYFLYNNNKKAAQRAAFLFMLYKTT